MSYQRDESLHFTHEGDKYICWDYTGLHKDKMEFSSAGAALAHLESHADTGTPVSQSGLHRLMAETLSDLTAQDLYDLREGTGFISGADLHVLFDALVGEPSPAGPVEVPAWKLENSEIGRQVLRRLVGAGLDIVRELDYSLS